MPKLLLANSTIRYNLYKGSGTPVVFVHGYGGHSEDWAAQVDALVPRYSAVVLDNRGHGESCITSDSAAYTVPEMVEDLISVVEHLKLSKLHLVGHSIGGAVVQEYARARRGTVASLSLVATTDWFGDHDEPGGVGPYIPPHLMELSKERSAQIGPTVLRLAWDGLLSWPGSKDWISDLECKTLVLLGDRGASRIHEGSQRLVGALGDCELCYFPGVGHSPHLEVPHAFSEKLLEFLAAAEG
ncbi:MAG: alpha/beta hydrolase [Cyanobacteria bacterium P01_F01_bin.13]